MRGPVRLQRLLSRTSKFIDLFPVAGPAVIIPIAILFVASAAFGLVSLVAMVSGSG